MNVRQTKGGIYRNGMTAILPKSRAVFMMDTDPRETYSNQQSSLPTYIEQNRGNNYMSINGNRICPNGPNNLFPQDLKRLLDKDESMHGMLRTKIDLLLAGGHYLYEEHMERDPKTGIPKITKYEVLDDEVSDYLESYNFDNYVGEAATDMIYVENNNIQFNRNIFGRSPFHRDKWKMHPEIIGAEDARLGWKDNKGKINHLYRADWTDPISSANPVQIPMMDIQNPWQHAVSAKFICFPSFASKYYGRPPFIGAVNYIELSSLIPYWHIDNMKNGDFVYHVETSWEYWDKVYKENGVTAGTEAAALLEDDILAEIDASLYSDTAENAKKRLHSKFEYDEVTGKPKPGLIITRLDEDVDKRSKAYIDLFKTTNEAKISGVHLDPALANVLVQGKLSSGSEKMHAFNLHTKVVTPMPRKLILWAPNFALKQSFPDRKLKIGFRDIELNTQDKGTQGYKELTNTEE
jgi:hypothetical protein